MTQKYKTSEKSEQWLLKSKQDKEYGTTHYPHGWLKTNGDFSGVSPTIDAGIWKHHTLLIEVQDK